jgi:hypothetical protein
LRNSCIVVVRFLALLCLAVSWTNAPAGAFMTFSWFGGAIHRAILKDALFPLGVQKRSLSIIGKGADSQDIPFSRKLAHSPRNHCDGRMLSQACEYWRSCLEQAVVDAGEADSNNRKRDRALFEFGEGMHTLQDFYSHANYLEWLLQNRLPMEPVNWDSMPPAVRTGYFYYGSMVSNDATCKRELAVRKLCRQNSELRFHSADQYQKRAENDSEAVALGYALDGSDFLHREVNKDHADTMEGRIVEPGSGKTLYALARELAAADTARQWKKLERLIRERYGTRSELIIERLKGVR